ncbi:hypothetical protein [Nitrosomonas supralitoralis]|uniref:Uncharacterized protein n=1 Tax=Nitrosomonas supralitoralis TaxID=2116706 RepID=A0A2P7NXY1_9PROT|nr:hypothetical protein [Nitrosomonas supralitoralis]PSJ18325.1 hypothetical protein C7H79_03845 [Nitrosomonas supralitoralis]
MIQIKEMLLTSIISVVFLFASASVFADYNQSQNKVDDKMNSPKPIEQSSSQKKQDDNKQSRQADSDKMKQNSSDNKNQQSNSGNRNVDPAGPRDGYEGQNSK